MIFWCSKCKIPVIKRNICPICNNKIRKIAKDIRPVFTIEKKVISELLQQDICDRSVWGKGPSIYIIHGKSVNINYSEIYKNKLFKKSLRQRYNNYTDFIRKIMMKNQSNIAKQDIYINKFLKANEQYIKMKEYEAHNYITKTTKKYNKNFRPIVSFSGGKDSAAVSNLVRDGLNNQKVFHFFGNTTLEFPTTYQYLERFKRLNPFTPFIDTKSDKNFFELSQKEFGPPSRQERWCCTIFKTGPIGEIINAMEEDGEGMRSISFMGIRARESWERGDYIRTQTNSKISRQIVSMPIFNWLDADVWLYILSKEMDFNLAYTMGFTRVGCWCCPNNSFRSNLLLYLNFYDLHKKWRGILIEYAKNAGIKDYEIYVDHGFWKARRGMRGMDKKETELQSVPCNIYDNAKLYFIEKNIDDSLPELFKPFGKIILIFDSDSIVRYEIKARNLNIHLEINRPKNFLKVIPIKANNLNLLYKRIECQIRKFEFCISCLACDNICSYKAINTTNGYRIDEDKCKHCLECIAKYTGGCLVVQKHKSKI